MPRLVLVLLHTLKLAARYIRRLVLCGAICLLQQLPTVNGSSTRVGSRTADSQLTKLLLLWRLRALALLGRGSTSVSQNRTASNRFIKLLLREHAPNAQPRVDGSSQPRPASRTAGG